MVRKETIMVLVPVKIQYHDGYKRKAISAALNTCRGHGIHSCEYSADTGNPKLMKTTGEQG